MGCRIQVALRARAMDIRQAKPGGIQETRIAIGGFQGIAMGDQGGPSGSDSRWELRESRDRSALHDFQEAVALPEFANRSARS